MAANSGHSWRRGTGNGKSRVRNNYSTSDNIADGAFKPPETSREDRRQRSIDDLQQKYRLLKQQLNIVDAKEEAAAKLLKRRLAEKVPDTFQRKDKTANTIGGKPGGTGDASVSHIQDLLAHHELLTNHAEEAGADETDGLATARLRSIERFGYTLDKVHARHKNPALRLVEPAVVRPGSALGELRAMAKIRDSRRQAFEAQLGAPPGAPALDRTGWAPVQWNNNLRYKDTAK
jgi:hypothetical protein